MTPSLPSSPIFVTLLLASGVAVGVRGGSFVADGSDSCCYLYRVSGGAGPGGVKAVAPTGVESITVTMPAEEQLVSVLGEKLSTVRPDGIDNFSAPGRPVAVISNVQVLYRPGPVPPDARPT